MITPQIAQIKQISFLIVVVVLLLHDLRDFLNALYLLQLIHDRLRVFPVVDAQLDAAVEQTVVAADGEFVDIDVHLRGDDSRNIYEDTHTVDTLNADGGVEEQLFMHVPLGIEDAVAETTLQLIGHRTGALVDFYLVLVVDISQDVVSGNGVTAVLELILSDSFLANVDG